MMHRLLILLLTLMAINVPVAQAQSEPPYETPAPEVTYVLDDVAMTITAVGEGTVTLYVQFIDNWTGQTTTENISGEGAVTFSIPRSYEDCYVNVWATALADGDANPGITSVDYYVEIPALPEVPIYETPAPEVIWIVEEDAVTFVATGEGLVTLYIQTIDNWTGNMTTETYSGDGSVTVALPRAEESYYVNVWATAQADENAYVGMSDTEYYIEIPAMEPIYETPAPVVTWVVDEDAVIFTATGEGLVTLYIATIDNETGNVTTESYADEGSVTVTLPRTYETYYVNAWATAQANENSYVGISNTEYFIEIPAIEIPEITEPPVINIEITDDGAIVTIEGEGYICLYYNDELITSDEGSVVWYISRGEVDEYYEILVTAQAEGKEMCYVSYVICVPAMPVDPIVTPAPDVTWVVDDEVVIFTATGEGTVTLYIQTIDNWTGNMTTESYDGEGSVTVALPRTDETYYVNVWATAQADENAYAGISDTEYFIEIPAKVEYPPHPQGDVNGDYIVNISDVTALINYLLSRSGDDYDPEIDVNQDGYINISDVTALINFLLTGSW